MNRSDERTARKWAVLLNDGTSVSRRWDVIPRQVQWIWIHWIAAQDYLEMRMDFTHLHTQNFKEDGSITKQYPKSRGGMKSKSQKYLCLLLGVSCTRWILAGRGSTWTMKMTPHFDFSYLLHGFTYLILQIPANFELFYASQARFSTVSHITVIHGKSFITKLSNFFPGCQFFDKHEFCNEPTFSPMTVVIQSFLSLKREIRKDFSLEQSHKF